MRPLTPRPEPGGLRREPDAEAPSAPAERVPAPPPWRLPPGAEMWRPAGPALRARPGAPGAGEAPAAVWRSRRPPRRPLTAAPGCETRPEHAPIEPATPEADAALAPASAVSASPPPAPTTSEPSPTAPTRRVPVTEASAPQAPAPEAPMVMTEPPAQSLRLRLRRRQTGAPRRRDPAPSRIAYRLNRLWLTPLVRAVVRVGVPAFVATMVLGALFADADRRDWMAERWTELRHGIEERPEFQVIGVQIDGASAPVRAALAALAPQEFPVSSFRLDLDTLRVEIEALDAVARAELRVRADGVLDLRVEEREPVAIWHAGEGLVLIDAEGQRVARLLARAGRADLPLLAGTGADAVVAEARALAAAASPLGVEFVALVRVGERRWDVVLEGDRRILLPERGAVAALERVLAQDSAQDLLARDLVVVDMRLPGRPTVRLSEAAVEELRRVRAIAPAGGSGGPSR